MAPKAIMRMEKRKGGAITISGRHNDRTQPVPNADPARMHLNRLLAGDERPTRKLVTEVIKAHGGKPRKDAVEAIEFLCKASPEFFNEKDPRKFQEKVDRFVEQAMKFLRNPESGGVLVKAVLHMDEHTPHIHAYKVPIDPTGKLNNKHYMRDREQMERNQDRYYEYMKPLGLERGQRRSRATHERIEDFYKSIDAPIRLEVDLDLLPDPPKVLITVEARKKYKKQVERGVLKQLEEPLKTMRDQAMLARHERGQREEAERKAAEVEREAAERVKAAERRAEERIAGADREVAERAEAAERAVASRVHNIERSARGIIDENIELREENSQLRVELQKTNEALLKMTREKLDNQMLAKEYSDRLTDIPMPEVMGRLGYEGERHGEALVYRGDSGQVAMLIEKQKAFDHQRELICKNSLDLVVHMRRENEGMESFNQNHALAWLQDEFGDKRAHGAYLANQEQKALEFFGRRNEERERTRALVHERSDDPWRGSQGRAEDHDRGSRDRGDSHDRGSSFGR